MSAAFALAIFLVAFVFLATEKVNKVKVVLIAAGIMAVAGLVPGAKVFFSQQGGIDWDVIFLLLGMMIIVGIIKQTGLFDYLGIWAAKKSQGRPYRLMVLLMLITAIASPILDNVTIIMLVVPVTIVVCNRLKIAAQPYIIAEVLASNIGGASTLIGDPPNMIVASWAGFTFGDFLIHMTPIVAAVFLIFVLWTRWLFRRSFQYNEENLADVMLLQERRAITDMRLLIRCLIVLLGVILAFCFHTLLDIDPSIVALIGAGVMLLVSKVDVNDVMEEIEWETLVFFMGLFVMVGGLSHTGIISKVGSWAVNAVGDNYFGAATALLFGSASLGAVFDNIPYAATMAPVVDSLAASIPDKGSVEGIWWAFTIGADFGGNGTSIAASANVVAVGLANRGGHPVSFWQFARYGVPTTIMSAVVAWGYIYLRYFF